MGERPFCISQQAEGVNEKLLGIPTCMAQDHIRWGCGARQTYLENMPSVNLTGLQTIK